MNTEIFPPDRISADTLNEFILESLSAMKLPEDTAKLLADSLIQADLWGHPSHGIMRLFWYGERIKSGAIQCLKEPEWVIDAGAVATLDGMDGVGQSIAAIAMQTAIQKAKIYGIAAISVRNSGHFGTAMYFTKMAADANCIGFLSSNASPAMAPGGGIELLLETILGHGQRLLVVIHASCLILQIQLLPAGNYIMLKKLVKQYRRGGRLMSMGI